MQVTEQQQVPRVLDDLYSEPWQFEFYQAVRLLALDALRRMRSGDAPATPVRFRSTISLVHAKADILALKPATENRPPEMTVTFLSLGGAFGPLPTSLSEEMIRRVYRDQDPAPIAFLDLFHDRILALAYSVRAAHHIALAITDAERTDQARFLFSLFGLGLQELQNRIQLPDRTFVRYAGLLASETRSAAGLEAILSDHFRVRVRVQQFIGGWFGIPASKQTVIGSQGQNRSLGDSAMLGHKVWDQSAGIRIHIGPLDFPQYRGFLPNRALYKELMEIVDFYTRQTLTVHLRLSVGSLLTPAHERTIEKGVENKRALPGLFLDGTRELGRTSWVRSPRTAAEVEFCRPGSGAVCTGPAA